MVPGRVGGVLAASGWPVVGGVAPPGMAEASGIVTCGGAAGGCRFCSVEFIDCCWLSMLPSIFSRRFMRAFTSSSESLRACTWPET